MNLFKTIRRTTVYWIPVVLLALLVVPAIHAQDTSAQILYAVADDKGDNTIYKMDLDSSLKTQIGIVHNDGSDAGWSPDGKFIYLLDNDEPSYPILTLINTETNSRQTVPNIYIGDLCSLPFLWSPHAQWLAYYTLSEEEPLLKILNLTNGSTQILADANFGFNNIMWSPDEQYLTYGTFSQSPGGRMAVWDVQNQQTVAVLNYSPSPKMPQWSPIENHLLYQAANSQNVVVYNIADRTEQKYSPVDRIGEWSPNGQFFTIYNEDENHQAFLSVIDIYANNVVQFDHKNDLLRVNNRAIWSSDGRYLALAVFRSYDNAQAMVNILDIVQKNSHPLVIDPPDYNAFIWSPVGNQLAFAYNQEYFDGSFFTYLWTFDADNQQSHHYSVRIPLMSYEPTLDWSPIGGYLIVRGDNAISLLNWATGQLRPITNANQNISLPRWSADGSRIALTSGGFNTVDLYVFTVADNTLKNITNTADEVETFLGWRGSQNRDSLIYCGEG